MSPIWTATLLAGAGTFAMRASFLIAARRMTTVPPWADRVLRQIPPAALAALVVPALVRPEGSFDLYQPRLAAGVLAALVAWKTRNVAATLVIGLAGLMAIEVVV
ncbi:MAG: AzlD domain-containing protein [Acidimicrobiia bacterium]|nr:AzlD domain-containing protein [Acidimicrobiia bacterium]